MPSNEFYAKVVDRKQDAELHRPILENEEADKFCRIQSARKRLEQGADIEVVMRLYEVTAQEIAEGWEK